MYKLYKMKSNGNQVGCCVKYECKINENEIGIFKLPINTLSRDHICESVAYKVAKVFGIEFCWSGVKNIDGNIGAFSRYEIDDKSKLVTLSSLTGVNNMIVDEYLSVMKRLLYKRDFEYCVQSLAIDFILGQRDRHFDNISVYKSSDKRHKRKELWCLYKMYDNGFCLASNTIPEHAVDELKYLDYSGRMGSGIDVLAELKKYRKYLKCFKRKEITLDTFTTIIRESDRYNQINEVLLKMMANAAYKRYELLVKNI